MQNVASAIGTLRAHFTETRANNTFKALAAKADPSSFDGAAIIKGVHADVIKFDPTVPVSALSKLSLNPSDLSDGIAYIRANGMDGILKGFQSSMAATALATPVSYHGHPVNRGSFWLIMLPWEHQ